MPCCFSYQYDFNTGFNAEQLVALLPGLVNGRQSPGMQVNIW
jgi:hypothetical protein